MDGLRLLPPSRFAHAKKPPLPKAWLHPRFAQALNLWQGLQHGRHWLAPEFMEQAQPILADLLHDRFLLVFGTGQAPCFNPAAGAKKPLHRNPAGEPLKIVFCQTIECRVAFLSATRRE